ncbi:MAG: hypothetical protein ILO34_02640, partial [Kiritimatiellae bacterium]|nr:hypothetical protein [Kiritimatiellia bacterium]
MKKILIGMMLLLLSLSVLGDDIGELMPVDLEWIVTYGLEKPDDFVHYPEPPYIPLRNRNSYDRFKYFVDSHGWTTNEFINELVQLLTNNVSDAAWADEQCRKVAKGAVLVLRNIPDPAVTNYFRSVMDRDDMRGLQRSMIIPMFQYTNLEPEVLDYMKSLCVKTNIYKEVSFDVAYHMYETLRTMPDEMKPAATNRVANFMYYSICHSIGSIVWQDEELARFLPAYSNSIQRLN